ncbi:MAG TPA: hypothetical protein VN317_10320 [Candidatus Methanoperedens sp.]|nr:hypothetical protein [Candidatus Methanoperedens sp.]
MQRAGLAGAALLLTTAALLATPSPARAAVVPGALVIRAAGRAPVQDGRVDLAFQQALEEAFRRSLLEALRSIAPERQSPRDLDIWQETVLSRAGDFVAAWRILAQREQGAFLDLETEVELWRDKLARAARDTATAAAASPVRLLVLAESFPVSEAAAEEEVDAGRLAAAALEAELSRRGAVIVSATDRAPWEVAAGPTSEENRVALAAAAGRRLAADAVLVARLTRRGEYLALAVQLIAVSSETTLGAARADVTLVAAAALDEAFLPAARQLAAGLVPRLAALRSGRARGALP